MGEYGKRNERWTAFIRWANHFGAKIPKKYRSDREDIGAGRGEVTP
jgi:hypothetical protein